MYIHREGKKNLGIAFLMLVVVNSTVIKFFHIQSLLSLFVVTLSIILYLWILYFFRNPTRKIAKCTNHILAPADGKIVAVKETYEPEYCQAPRIQISIFMSPFNVHVNRSPITGVVKFFKYHAGKYLVAFHPKSSTKNERTTIVVENAQGVQILFRQIAGFMARRIKYYLTTGDQIQQGDEVGFIKFGSRVDVFCPLEVKIKVKPEDHVKGGISILAEI